jgi:amino acid transporter/mannitol/fructose-specific phosphotransferase system IIA component (Ntr-type)
MEPNEKAAPAATTDAETGTDAAAGTDGETGSPPPAGTGRTLRRDLGLLGVCSVSIGAMMGGGIFVLPGLAAAMTGPSVWLAYLAAVLLVIPAALSKAELATAIPQAGGTYLFIDRAMGPLAGTSVGLGLWLSLLLKACFALVGIGAYLSIYLNVPVRWLGLLVLAGVLTLNILGVKKVGRLQMVLVLICLSALGIVAVKGLASIQPDLLLPHTPKGITGFFAATGFVFISYAGVTQIAAVAEEVKNPARNIPAGIMLSAGLMAATYSLVALALVGTISYVTLTQNTAPIAALGERLFGYVGGIVLTCVAVLALISMANAGVLATSRFPLAMSRDKLLPGWLAKVHRKYITPVASLSLTCAVMAAAIMLLDVERIVKLASTFQILVFCFENLAVVIFRESGAQWYRPKFKVPAYPWMQIFGVVGGIGLVALMGGFALAAALVVTLFGMAWYWVYAHRRVDRTGVLQLSLSKKEIIEPQVPRAAGEEAPLKPAQVVMPLFGWEKSSETMLRLGAALAQDTPLKILHLKEVPEQTQLEDLAHEEDMMASLRRRLTALAIDLDADAHFDAIVSRSNRRTLHEVVNTLGCRWAVMEWRRPKGLSELVYNPMEWLVKHLPCNVALFKDTGITVFREIMVVAEPGPHDALVARTANRLAKIYGARLTFANVLPKSAKKPELQSVADYHDQLRGMCQCDTSSKVVTATDRVAQLTHLTASFDLVLIGAPPERSLWGMVFGDKETDTAMAEAVCSVLRLTTPPRTTHQVPAAALVEAEVHPTAARFLAAKAVRTRLAVRRKDALFTAISEGFADAVAPDISAQEIETAFWSREMMQNTAIGEGVALPHATIASADRTYLGIFTLAHPLDFQAFDGQPVQICLATLGPPGERETHVRLLATLARLIMKTDLIKELKTAAQPYDAVSVFGNAVDKLKEIESGKGGA